MRILHLITWLNRGGIEKWLLEMSRMAREGPIAFDFCCKGSSRGELADVAERQGAIVWHCPMGWNPLRFVHELRGLLVQQHYDVVHNHLQSHAGLAVAACLPLGIPVVSSFHNTDFPGQRVGIWPGARRLREAYSNWSICYAVQHSATVTGCSQSVCHAVERIAGVEDRGRVLYYGIDMGAVLWSHEEKLARRAELCRQFGWDVASPWVVHVGRFVPQKNHHAVIDIFSRVRRENPAARLLMIGDGPLRTEIETMAATQGLKNDVRFLGLRDDVPAILALADVFLFPSRHEGFGIAALEANAAGVPVVGSNIPGLTEAIENGETGLLLDADDVDSMATAVTRLLDDPERAARMGRAGRFRAERDFSSSASFARLEAIYQGILTAGPTAHGSSLAATSEA